MPKDLVISEDGFLNMLANQNGGAIIEELDRELIKGIAGIQDFGGESTITLKIKINPIKNLEKCMNITPTVSAKHPQEPPVSKAMFVSQGNGLVDQYQQQEELPMERPIAPVKANLKPIEGNKNA